MENLLEIKNVTLTYCSEKAQTDALKGLSFSVKRGEFIAVVGPSGCGKTTLLSILSGTLAPTSGKVVFKNNVKIGYMLQRDYLFEWRSVMRNVLLGPETEKTLDDNVRNYVCGLLKKYGLWDFRNANPNRLSGGMRQRAALIRTLAIKPDLLLLDEPFSALDFQTRLSVCDDVYKAIKKEKKTALLVTHDIGEAISVADRIIVLSPRPASVRKIRELGFGEALSPSERRESPEFPVLFKEIRSEIASNRTASELSETTAKNAENELSEITLKSSLSELPETTAKNAENELSETMVKDNRSELSEITAKDNRSELSGNTAKDANGNHRR